MRFEVFRRIENSARGSGMRAEFCERIEIAGLGFLFLGGRGVERV